MEGGKNILKENLLKENLIKNIKDRIKDLIKENLGNRSTSQSLVEHTLMVPLFRLV